MNLSEVDFYIDWPVSIEVKGLRKYLTKNLEKKGDVIRWSIIDVQNSITPHGAKKIKIKAVFADYTRV